MAIGWWYKALWYSIWTYSKTFCFSDLIGPLIVEFVSDQFEHVESSTQFSISLSLGGGTSAFDIMAIILPFDQSPVSAEGEWHIPFNCVD